VTDFKMNLPLRLRYLFHKFLIPYSLFNDQGSVHCKNILIYIQQDATLHTLFYLETVLHVSNGISIYHQERKQLYLQHLVFATPLLLSAAIVPELELFLVCCGTYHSTLKPVPTLPR